MKDEAVSLTSLFRLQKRSYMLQDANDIISGGTVARITVKGILDDVKI